MSKKFHEEHIEENEEFDDLPSSLEDLYDGDISEIMSSVFQAAHHQMQIALELTKLALEKATSNATNEAHIFSTYRQALKEVADSSPLQNLLEKIGQPG